MRVRTAAVSVGIAALAAVGLSAPAQAAPQTSSGWTEVGSYYSNSACVSVGQSYEREGWNAYKCVKVPGYEYPYVLYIM